VGIGTSLFLIAVGAIVRYAVTDTIDEVNLATVGLILMVVGAVGLVVSLFWAAAVSRRGDETYVEPADRGYVRR
jgi:hypothetical protein